MGLRSLEEFILPLMLQALTGLKFLTLDEEEFVVEKVINSLAALAEVI